MNSFQADHRVDREDVAAEGKLSSTGVIGFRRQGSIKSKIEM